MEICPVPAGRDKWKSSNLQVVCSDPYTFNLPIELGGNRLDGLVGFKYLYYLPQLARIVNGKELTLKFLRVLGYNHKTEDLEEIHSSES